MCSGHTRIEFASGINVLVGPNGSGKSTILSSLLKAGTGNKNPDFKIETDGAGKVIHFDTERGNPRTANRLRDDSGIYAQVAMMFSSHGQSVRPIVTRGLTEAIDKNDGSNTLALIDEPEAAMDIDGVDAFIQTLCKLLEEKPVQFVVASHSPLIWRTPKANVIELVPGYINRAMARFLEACKV